MNIRHTCAFLTTALAITALPHAAAAQTKEVPADNFYKDRQIRLIVGTDAGGSYDASGRLVARHIAKHIAGAPSVVVQNMPGAASLNAANYVYNVAPQDGSVIVAVVQTMPQQQLFGDKNVKFDAAKFQWIGNPSTSVSVVMAWHTSPVKSIADAFQTSIIMGAAGRVGNDATVPAMLNNVLGTKFNIVAGYKGGNEIDLAMERGEVAGRAGQSWDGWKVTRPDWIKTGKLVPLVQVGIARAKDLPDVPLASELAKSDEQKQIIGVFSDTVALGRPLLAGPGVPATRVAVLRDAFRKTMQDAELLEEARKMNFDVTPIYGEDVQAIVARIMATPPAIVERARDAVIYKDPKAQ